MAMSRNAKRRIDARAKDLEALQLRKAGMSYEQIARAMTERGMKISSSGAHKAVSRALDELVNQVAEEAKEVRALELARLDQLQLAAWERAMAGDTASIETIRRLMGRRAALLGLDRQDELEGDQRRTPTRVEIVVSPPSGWTPPPMPDLDREIDS